MTSGENNSAVWHPFTQHATAKPPLNISRSEGAWLETKEGQRIYDAISSWWVVTHGHRHPKIVEAVKAQTEKLDQVIFAGFTHEPGEQLAHRLVTIAPKGLSRAFFADSGSTAVEVAVKMALGFWHNLGQTRPKLVAFEHAYHGDTVAAMSAGARGVFNTPYEPLLFDVERIPFPAAGHEQATIDALENICRQGGVAGLIIEPLVLGAGGMLMYPASVITEMKRVLDAYDVLLIADEVMTGWGRTGTMFAIEQANISPDILCSAKGITGGIIPLAVTLASDRIFDAHYSTDRKKTFFHSSSYTANPICCAAANANLDIWDNEPVLNRISNLSAQQSDHLSRLAQNPMVENARQCATLTAVDIVTGNSGYMSEIGPKIMAFAISNGVLIRPLGNTLYLMPPYCTTTRELKRVYEVIDEALEMIGNEC
ncbi:MAG: adenosylmethionine--8-amino-7-oxononanoate transaminase [Hyphomicrobiaceae bacterium]